LLSVPQLALISNTPRTNYFVSLELGRQGFHVDVNVGDPVWPNPGLVEVPRLLGGVITVTGYPLSMVLAEKIVTALQRGSVNTRPVQPTTTAHRNRQV
jgi:hypothetical protein